MTTSVALCTYNGEKHIKEQILSITNQSVKVDEIVLCDDCSTDSTLSIVREISTSENKINFKIIENEVQLGVMKNFEKAILQCTNEIIFLSDQDDNWDKDKVKKILSIFSENSKIEGVFSDGHIMNEEGQILPNQTLWESFGFYPKQIKNELDLKSILWGRNYVTGAALTFKRESILNLFPFPIASNENKAFRLHDYWIAFNLANKKSLHFTEEKLMSYRVHQKQEVGIPKRINNTNNQILIDVLCEKKPYNDLNINQMKKTLKLYARIYHFDTKYPKEKKLESFELPILIGKYKKLKKVMTKKYPIISNILFTKYRLKGDVIN